MEIPSCALDERAQRRQRARYERLAPSVKRFEREPDALVVDFDGEFDPRALQEALAVERECCPFFEFAFDERERRLRVTVTESEQLPALDALAHAMTRPRRSPPASRRPSVTP